METPHPDPSTTLLRGLARENATLRELLAVVAGALERLACAHPEHAERVLARAMRLRLWEAAGGDSGDPMPVRLSTSDRFTLLAFGVVVSGVVAWRRFAELAACSGLASPMVQRLAPEAAAPGSAGYAATAV
jgi:hypothetical protein